MRFVPTDEKIVYKSYKELRDEKKSSLNICNLSVATEQQKETFPDMVWDEDSVFGWITANNFYTKELVYVPAQMAYWGYKRPASEPNLSEINTNGLGAGYSDEEAILSGMGELIQRHSFFTYWYTKNPLQKFPCKVFYKVGILRGVLKGS